MISTRRGAADEPCAGAVSHVRDLPVPPGPSAQMRQGQGDPRFVGNWQLVSFVNIDDKGATTASRFTGGRIMYDAAGQMAAQLTIADRPALPSDPSEAAARRRLLRLRRLLRRLRHRPGHRQGHPPRGGLDQSRVAEDRSHPLLRVRGRRQHAEAVDPQRRRAHDRHLDLGADPLNVGRLFTAAVWPEGRAEALPYDATLTAA